MPRKRWPAIAGGAAIVVALAGAGTWLALENRRGDAGMPLPPEAPAETRIAVLPFENLGAPDDAYFADGMTDEVRGKLSGLPGLAVIARTSSNHYRETTKSPAEIAKELGVSHLLTATVRWQKGGGTNRIRVAPELVEIGPTGSPVTRWNRTFDADLADVFEVQAGIATQVAEALKIAIGTTDASRIEARPTSNLAAYDAFVRGRELLTRQWGPAATREAISHFEAAVALDPAFAMAWAWLAMSHADLADWDPSARAESGERSRFAAERANALRPDDPESHIAVAAYHLGVRGDPDAAIAALERGLEISPDNALLLESLGHLYARHRNRDEGLEHIRRAAELDPYQWRNFAKTASFFIITRQPRAARGQIERGLAIQPAQYYLIIEKLTTFLQEGDLSSAHAAAGTIPESSAPRAIASYLALYPTCSWSLLDAQRDLLLRIPPNTFDENRAQWGDALSSEYALRGRSAEARKHAELAKAAYLGQIAKNPKDFRLHASLARVLGLLAEKNEAESHVATALELAATRKDIQLAWTLEAIAVAHVRLENHDAAVDTLERLLTVPHPITKSWLRIDPNYAPLKGNRRFEALTRP